ncbi:MAG: hypothetical protein PHU06_06320 [Gallionella sp.]|nr:hypothetical protein [Gallionella sp.]MDD4958419.1 hypothetical protein [Gallionella sp.]
MSDQQAYHPEEPGMVAWTAYKTTDDYAYTKRWAKHSEHVDVSLWSAFSQGFADGVAEQGIKHLASLMDTARTVVTAEILASARISEDEMVEAMARAMCFRNGTSQCAAICLTRFASDNRQGRCSDAIRVHGENARAAFTAIKPALARLAAENAVMREVATRAAQVAAEMSEEWRCGKAAELMDALQALGEQP